MTADAATAPAEVESPWRQAGLQARHRRRRLLLAVVVAFTVVSAATGFPTGREVLTAWLLLTLLAACGGEVRVWWRAVVRDWLPLLAVLWSYDLLRGLANEVGGALWHLPTWVTNNGTARAHLSEPIAIDKLLFGGTVPTVWLQERLYDPGTAHWYDVLAIPVYMSHFLVSLVVAVALWCVSYRQFRRYLSALVTLTVITLVTYLLLPAAPPWMAALNGRLPGLDCALQDGRIPCRVVQETITTLGGSTLGSAVERGAAYSNPVAALPSLHAAIPMLLLLLFYREARTWVRVVLVSYALSMAMVLVYGGEHYVTDVLLGWLYAAITVLAVNAWHRRYRAAPVPSPAS